ncbi:hypothetical protein [Bifidobacterium aquikefiri]|uniref:hypothetical protein n=1 Tax=Bifidobacterium aquikefiri TaxID=1653207 RepID=UPI0039E8FD91
MVMPANGQYWPPLNQNNIQTDYRQHDAWYTGDEDQLSTIYSSTQNAGQLGLFGQVKRFFWGTPTPANSLQRPVKAHIPLPAEIARMSAAQLFAEMPTGSFANDTSQLTDTLTALLDDDAHSELLQAAEFAAAFGGAYLKVTWDTSADTKPFITAVAPDNALPTFGLNGHLQSVIFWNPLPRIEGVKREYTLVEEYTPGHIEYGLYESANTSSIGTRVPLDVHPVTSSLEVDANSQIATGSSLLTVVYIPNLKPNRRLRKDPSARFLGRSDFEGAEPIFDMIDEAYTSWMRDIRLGKARVFASRSLLQQHGPGHGASFNTDQEIFTPLESAPGSILNQNSQLETFQPNIRWEEHQQTCKDLIERAYVACGYSSSTFGQAGDVAMTATEVQAREKLTMLTRGSKILYWRPQLARLYAALMDVNDFVFNGPARGDEMPDIEFPPAATDSPNTVAQTLNYLNDAESTSVATRVRMLHPDWDVHEVNEEVAQIKSDLSMLPISSESNLYAAVADNGSTTGGVQTDAKGSYSNDHVGADDDNEPDAGDDESDS